MTTYYFSASGDIRDFAELPKRYSDFGSLYRLPSVLLTYATPSDIPIVTEGEKSFTSWTLDSGAYSVANSGKTIDLNKFIEDCKKLRGSPKLDGIFALDVIGDWKASLRNTEKMWEAGIPAIPTFHYGEPRTALVHMAKNYPRIAIGGCAKFSAPEKKKWAKACFKEVWPKRIHGLGFGAETLLKALPFDSVDSTSWVGPRKYGQWRKLFKGVRTGHGVDIDGLIRMIRSLMDLETRTRVLWKSHLKEAASEYLNHPLVKVDRKFYSKGTITLGVAA